MTSVKKRIDIYFLDGLIVGRGSCKNSLRCVFFSSLLFLSQKCLSANLYFIRVVDAIINTIHQDEIEIKGVENLMKKIFILIQSFISFHLSKEKNNITNKHVYVSISESRYSAIHILLANTYSSKYIPKTTTFTNWIL